MKKYKKFGISVEKKIHGGWIEHNNLMKGKGDKIAEYKKLLGKTHPMGYFGKWQFIFTSKKGAISLVILLDYHRIGEHIYEIFCLDEMKIWKDEVGNDVEVPTSEAKKILPDIRRFYKREDAIKNIIEILRDNDKK